MEQVLAKEGIGGQENRCPEIGVENDALRTSPWRERRARANAVQHGGFWKLGGDLEYISSHSRAATQRSFGEPPANHLMEMPYLHEHAPSQRSQGAFEDSDIMLSGRK